jgi:hypothetical protein
VINFFPPRPRPSGEASRLIDAQIEACWSSLSVRDIASKLDLTVRAIECRAENLGLGRRPAWMKP